jgi:rhodanese-related sulfurtransferase
MTRVIEILPSWIDATSVWRHAHPAYSPVILDLRPANGPETLPPTDAEIVGAHEAVRLSREGVTLVDLRDEALFAKGHICGARNLPLKRLLRDWDRPGEPVVVYDADGDLIERHVGALREAIGDLQLFVLDGGLEGWIAEGLPLER